MDADERVARPDPALLSRFEQERAGSRVGEVFVQGDGRNSIDEDATQYCDNRAVCTGRIEL